MKVLHIEDRFHPGMGYQINYFAEFHNPEFEFHILSSKSFSLWRDVNSEEILNLKDKEFEIKHNVKIFRLDSYRSSGDKHNIWLKNLIQTIERISPDVVYTHALETYTSIRVILSKLDKKCLIVSDTHTLMNQQALNLRSKIYNIFLHHIYIPAINRKNVPVFYTAEENRKILTDIYNIKKENVFPCLIGTNLEDYKYDEKAGKVVRESLNINLNSLVILYTGKMNGIKKPHLLLQAVKEIEDSLKGEIHLLLVGPQDKNYIRENFNVNFSDNVKLHLLNSVANKELFKYYSSADFAVFPKENTLSALDAQACRLPVIMEEDETNKFRLKEGGLCYKKNDIPDLGSRILTLANNNELLKILSESGYRYIKTNFDYKNIVKQMENVIEDRYKDYFNKKTK